MSCDGCERKIHAERLDLNASELKVIALKGKRLLKCYCKDCLTGVRVVPNLMNKIDELLSEVEELKSLVQKEPCSCFSEETVINEIYERQKRMKNVPIFNLAEGNSYNSDLNTVKEIVKEVTHEDLHIKRILVIFSSAEDAIKLIKSKEKKTLKVSRIFLLLN